MASCATVFSSGLSAAASSVFPSFLPFDSAIGYQDFDGVPLGEISVAVESETREPLSMAERERLVLEHLPTVRYVARRLQERLPQHVELDDLMSAGTVGLIDACSRFDPEKQVQFRTFAQFRIRGAILDSLRLLDWSPRELRRRGREVEQARHALTQRLGATPGEPELAAELGVGLEELQRLLGELKGLEIGSLNAECNEEGGEDELVNVPGAPEDDPLFQCLRAEQRESVAAALETLPERERLVMTLYYFEELTMKEIGAALGVGESRVSQMHSAAVRRLRGVFGVKETNGVKTMRASRTGGARELAQAA